VSEKDVCVQRTKVKFFQTNQQETQEKKLLTQSILKPLNLPPFHQQTHCWNDQLKKLGNKRKTNLTLPTNKQKDLFTD